MFECHCPKASSWVCPWSGLHYLPCPLPVLRLWREASRLRMVTAGREGVLIPARSPRPLLADGLLGLGPVGSA